MVLKKVPVAFKMDADIVERLKAIAIKERRSVSGLLNIVVEEQVRRYENGGLRALLYKQVDTQKSEFNSLEVCGDECDPPVDLRNVFMSATVV